MKDIMIHLTIKQAESLLAKLKVSGYHWGYDVQGLEMQIKRAKNNMPKKEACPYRGRNKKKVLF